MSKKNFNEAREGAVAAVIANEEQNKPIAFGDLMQGFCASTSGEPAKPAPSLNNENTLDL